MTTYSMSKKQEVYEEGVNAYLAGDKMDNNPYEGTEWEDDWMNGWLDQEQESEYGGED